MASAPVIGLCVYCALELYGDGPVQHYPDGRLAHVACHVDALRKLIA